MQGVEEEVDVVLQALRTLRFLLQHLDSSQCCGKSGRSLRGGEDKAACFILEIVDDYLAGAGIAALGTESLAERAHENVRLAGAAKMLKRAMTGFADNTCSVGFVNHRQQMIFFAQLYECRQVNNIAVHTENCVADN